jgi:hypothetical protein
MTALIAVFHVLMGAPCPYPAVSPRDEREDDGEGVGPRRARGW